MSLRDCIDNFFNVHKNRIGFITSYQGTGSGYGGMIVKVEELEQSGEYSRIRITDGNEREKDVKWVRSDSIIWTE
jgi:hypothetical protein